MQVGCPAQMRQHLSETGQRPNRDLKPIGTPRNPDGTVNYAYLDHGEWWNLPPGYCGELGRGFVSNARFASTPTERVIPRADRAKQRRKS